MMSFSQCRRCELSKLEPPLAPFNFQCLPWERRRSGLSYGADVEAVLLRHGLTYPLLAWLFLQWEGLALADYSRDFRQV